MLTVGFGTSVAMWLTGFVTHLPGVGLPPTAIAGLLLLIQFTGGLAAGRFAGELPAKRLGLGAGIVSALLNLLIVGSVVASETQTNSLRSNWPVIVLGTIASGAAVGLIGAMIGARRKPLGDKPATANVSLARVWLARFAVVAAFAALPVLLSGGLVTSTGAGLAVPDWPTSYSANMFLYPLSKMTGGIYYEHAHRLFGSLVGLTTLTLLLFSLACEPRRWMKALTFAAFVFVCGQGVLGGVRVTSADAVTSDSSPGALVDNKGSLALAMVHGITAQLFFALLCGLAAMYGVRWITHRADARAGERGLRTFSIFLVLGLVLQLSLGSAARHLHHPHVLWTHVGFAFFVVVLAGLAGFRAIARCKDLPPVRRLGHALVHSVGLQAILGLVTLMAVLPYQPGKVDSLAAVVLATAHQGLGAILIGCASMLMAWAIRLGGTHRPAIGNAP
ncbi:MAG: COX15/CtaA family protein [Phycisphaerae bacterium]|nr:COX15/CtaA family protein [Phycisphaerae bacterium]